MAIGMYHFHGKQYILATPGSSSYCGNTPTGLLWVAMAIDGHNIYVLQISCVLFRVCVLFLARYPSTPELLEPALRPRTALYAMSECDNNNKQTTTIACLSLAEIAIDRRTFCSIVQTPIASSSPRSIVQDNAHLSTTLSFHC